MALDEGYLLTLKDWALKNRGEPVIADDDLRCSDVGELVDEILKLRAVVAELGDPCNWDAVLKTTHARNEALHEVERLEEEITKTRQEMGDEMDRIVLDWHKKVQEVEAELARVKQTWHPPDGNCSACDNPLIPMWVCDQYDCGGHDGDGDV